MKRKTWIALFLAAGLLAVGFFGLVQLNVSFVIPKLKEYAREKWHQDISIGKASVSFYRGLSLKIEDLRWSSRTPAVFSTDLKEFYLRLRLGPLFRGVFEISDMTLRDPVIVITRRAPEAAPERPGPTRAAEGAGASGAVSPMRLDTLEKPPDRAASPKPGRFLFRNIDLGSFALQGGRLIYEDLSGRETRKIILERINLRAERMSGAKTYALQGTVSFESLPAEIRGTVGPVPEETDPAQIPFRLELTADNLMLKMIRSVFPKWMTAMEKVEVSGPETFTLTVEGAPGDLKIKFFEIATPERIKIGDLFLKKEGVDAEFSLTGKREGGEQFLMESFQAKLGPLALTGAGRLLFSGVPAAHIEAEMPPFPAESISQFFPPLAPYQLGGDLAMRLLYETQSGKESPHRTEGEITWTRLLLLFPNFKAPLESDKLTVRIAPERITLLPALFQWSEGLAHLEGQVDNYWQKPRWGIKGDLNGLTTSDIFPPPNPKQISFNGTFSGNFEFKGSLEKGKPWFETALGSFDLVFQDGEILAFNFLRKLDLLNELAGPASQIPFLSPVLSEALGRGLFTLTTGPNTEFEIGRFQGRLEKGVLSLSRIEGSSRGYDLEAKGEYRIAERELTISGKIVLSYENTKSLTGRIPEFAKLRDQKGRVTLYFALKAKDGNVQVQLVKHLVWDALQSLIVNPSSHILALKPKGTEAESGASSEKEPESPTLVDELIDYGLTKILGRKEKAEGEDSKP